MTGLTDEEGDGGGAHNGSLIARFAPGFIESAPIGLVVVGPVDGAIHDVNEGFCGFVGYSREELLGQTVRLITPASAPQLMVDDVLAQVRVSGRPLQMEKQFVRKDGGAAWGAMTIIPVADGGDSHAWNMAQVLDITARKAAEEALAASERLFHAAFDGAPIGKALFTPDGRFLRGNTALTRMLGYANAEMAGMSFLDLTHPDDRPESTAAFQEVVTGSRTGYLLEKRYLRKDGSTVWGRLSVSCIRSGTGEVEQIIGQFEDISETRAARIEVDENAARFAAMIEKSSDVMMIVREDADELWMSPAIDSILGHVPEMSLSEARETLLHPDDDPAVRRMMREVQAAPDATSR
ncbi:MAG: PAS domain-containing protein, partial [Thermomicrobiales bacterium]